MRSAQENEIIKDVTIRGKLIYVYVLLCLFSLSACAEDPIHITTMQLPPATGKIRVSLLSYSGIYMVGGARGEDWPQSHGVFVKTQAENLNKALADIGSCEIVDSKDVQSVFGGKLPSHSSLKRNDWKLARETGKALFADYVFVVERGFTTAGSVRVYFSATLINVESGKVFLSSNDDSVAQTAQVLMSRLTDPTYKNIFRDAKEDLLAQRAKNKTYTITSTAQLAPIAAPVTPEALSAKRPLTDKAQNYSTPAINIISPDISHGTGITKTSKIAVIGKAEIERGVSEVYVNGKSASLAEDGSFTTDIFLKVGQNDVMVVAIDTQGNKVTQAFNINRQSELSPKTAIAPPSITLISPDTERGVKVVSVSKLVVAGKVTSEKGVAEVYVNGQTATLGENGDFTAEILLKVGENDVTVEALDTMGNRGTHTFKIQRQSQMMAKPKEESKPLRVMDRKYYALIIGNNNYKFMPKLDTARNDAIEIDKVLKDRYGFETRC